MASSISRCILAIQVAVIEVAKKFYDRQDELDTLEKIFKQCQNSYGKITVLTGRRRVGKTLLANEYAKNKKNIYLFTSKKAEQLLCYEFMAEYEDFTGSRHIGQINKFIEIFKLLLINGKENPYILIIDEFQEFNNINQQLVKIFFPPHKLFLITGIDHSTSFPLQYVSSKAGRKQVYMVTDFVCCSVMHPCCLPMQP